MSLQSPRPLEHHSLRPAFKNLSELVKRVEEGELDLGPAYQRGDVWTTEQRLYLVKSWLLGVPTGAVVLSDRTNPRWTAAHPDRNPNNTVGEPMWACVDGKQRITTGVMFHHDELALPASWLPEDHTASAHRTADGPYVLYSGLTRKGRLLFDRHAGLQVTEARYCADEAEEASLYLLVNGTGTGQAAEDLDRAARTASRHACP
ncbi:DUF262 domain-containing protein [Kitasatospora sp. NPDC088783]|uniref:DUF262 domain-containing protein n=1 Tax=Kitasatospora sp. NPDC088783 TaxID=3364077 RepID=UPI0037F148A9